MGSLCTKSATDVVSGHKPATESLATKKTRDERETPTPAAPPPVSTFEFLDSGFGVSVPNRWDEHILSALLNEKPTKLDDSIPFPSDNGLVRRGPVLLDDGSVYCGQWKDTSINGLGQLFGKDGSQYIGEFANGHFHGEGEFRTLAGDVYKGMFKDGLKCGKGILTFNNGDNFDGTFKNDLRNGYGIERFKDGSVYMGNFKDNNRFGNGELKMADGTVYEGNFNDGINGTGVMKWTTGETHKGSFKNGMKHGNGVTTWEKGPVTSQAGTYKNGKKHGSFRTVMCDGSVVDGVYFEDTLVKQVDQENSPTSDDSVLPHSIHRQVQGFSTTQPKAEGAQQRHSKPKSKPGPPKPKSASQSGGG